MRIAWVSVGAMTDPIDGRVYPPHVVEVAGRRTSQLASVRLRLLAPMTALERRGHEVELLAPDPASFGACVDRLREFDAIVFRKTVQRGQFVVDLFDRAVEARVPTVFDICDLRIDQATEAGRRNLKMLQEADRVVASTPPLAEAVRPLGASETSVITDPCEGPRGEPAWRPQPDRLKALWFGHPSNLDTLQALLDELVAAGRRRPIQLTILTGRVPDLARKCKEFNQRWRQVVATRYDEWSLEATWAALAATDIVVIPSLPDAPDKVVKSPNRIVESLWAWRCVVANPLPAYVPFAGWAFIDDSIARGLDRALEAQAGVVDRVRAAQAYIADAHSPAKIGEQWEEAIGAAVAAKRRQHRPSPRAA